MNQSQKSQSRAHRADDPAPAGRKNPDKGLPDEAALLELAHTYLDIQRRLWPELVRTKILPPTTAKSAAELGDQFRDLFLGDDPPPEYPSQSKLWKQLGAAYLRYSCDNSNPRSLDQQLKNVLERAARDRVFIPWAYVFADAAVTGTTAARRGYQLAKAAVRLGPAGPHCVYVDEIGRASRDAIEALRLGKLIEKWDKRMVGATDGFDSKVEHWKILLQTFAMLQEWYVDQLRTKVRRGMADGFLQGKNLGRAPLGYKLVSRTDTNGNSLLDDDGRTKKEKAINEVGAEHVRKAFHLFAVERLSREKIGRLFNEKEVGGQRSWDATRIKKLLTRETYTGVEFYGMTYQVRDSETGEVETFHRPQEEWNRREVPHLRIVPDDLWEKTQKRLRECREAYHKRRGDKEGPTRSSVYPTLLVRPVCGYCGSELALGRSGKYASFCCLNGSTGKKGCRLRTYKMVGIVEKVVVNHLKSAVFTAEFVGDLVVMANAHLRAEGKRPKEDAGPIRAEIKNLKVKQDRLLALCEAGSGNVHIVAAKLRAYDAKLKELEARLREVEVPATLPAAITPVDVERMITDLHALLGEDTTTVAPILRELTGPVTVTQDEPKSKRGATWIAKFSVNLVPVLARLTRQRDCPTSGAWEFLSTAGWKSPHPCKFPVDFVPKYLALASRVKELADGKASLTNIATALDATYDTVRNALVYARSGERPKTKPAGQRTGTRTGPPQYLALAREVARLRDDESVPFTHIAVRLDVCVPTVHRAYDYAHRDDIRVAVQNGQQATRGTFVRIAMDVRREILERLDDGQSPEFIAVAVGCSAATVRKIRRER